MALEYTLPVVLHIFRVDSDDRKIELCGGGGIHSLVVPLILRVDSDDKGLYTLLVLSSPPAYHGMQADEICDVSGVLELSGGGGIHSPGWTAHPPG